MHVKSIINEVDELKKFSEMKFIDVDEKVHLSDVYVFFLTKDFIKTEKFIKDFKYAKKSYKLILPVLIENFDLVTVDKLELNNFSLMSLANPNKAGFERLQIFLLRALEIEKIYYDIKVSYWNEIELLNIKYFGNLSSPITFEVLSTDEIFVGNEWKRLLRVINLESGDLSKEIRIPFPFVFCWIEHAKKIFIADKYLNHEFNLRCILYNKNGKLFRNFKIPIVNDHILSIAYNSKSCYIYLLGMNFGTNERSVLVLDENFKIKGKHKASKSAGSIKTINDLVILTISPHQNVDFDNNVSSEAKILSLYNKNMILYTHSIMPADIKFVVVDSLKPSYIYIQMKRFLIAIYNIDTFSVLSYIKNPNELCAVVNCKMIFTDKSNRLLFYKINFENNENLVDERYICKMNKYNPHYFKDPYLLPCKNSACFKCILNNYNLHKNTIKCNFDSCLKEHKLPAKLDTDEKRARLMVKYNNVLFEEMIEYSNKLLNATGMISSSEIRL